MAPRMRRTTGVVAALLLTAAVAGCTPDGQSPPATTTTAIAGPSQVTMAVYGPDPVISAYTAIAARFSAEHPAISVNVRPYADHESAMAALRKDIGTSRAPDIFLSGENDLKWLRAAKATQDVDEMLSDRNIDFGDGYERVGLEAFSADSALQCMPVDVSPLVVYYNARLVHLAKIRPAGTEAAQLRRRLADVRLRHGRPAGLDPAATAASTSLPTSNRSRRSCSPVADRSSTTRPTPPGSTSPAGRARTPCASCCRWCATRRSRSRPSSLPSATRWRGSRPATSA